MEPRPTVGYIGVDVLNNATICNEAAGLLEAGARLDVVSVYRFDRPTFYQEGTLAALAGRLHHLYPLEPWSVARDVARAPFEFGARFWKTLRGAITCPAEGVRERLKILGHLLPAIQLARHWKDRGIGHVHAHWAHTATTIGMHAAGLMGVGFSFTGHANDLFVHKVGLAGKVRRARFIVCISEFHRRFYLGLGADPARLPVVYCGIDLGRFRPEGAEKVGVPRIVSVGRLVEKKGFADLIAACGLLRDRGVGFECVIAGSGPLEGELRERIARLGLGDRVRVTGRVAAQEDLPGLLESARAFALPCVRDADGDMDGLPQVLIEAMACGVPVVSTRLVGIPDLVRDGRNGVLVEPGDIPGLADALEGLIDRPGLAAALGAEAAAWAHAHFGRAETVGRLTRLFAWAAATPGDSPPAAEALPGPAPGSDAEYDAAGAKRPAGMIRRHDRDRAAAPR